MLDSQISDFWNWFIKNSSNLHSNDYNRLIIDELDKTISDWGLVWEIGPGLKKENSLTISPNGEKKLVNKAKGIIDKAPKLYNWEFYFAKQAKENWYLLRLVDTGVEINAADWTYVLLVYEDDKTEILVKADNLKQLDNETKELIVDLILTNLLGEELKIEKIDCFDLVIDFDSKKGVTELKFLPLHITSKKYFK
jgi:hypothetical protein